MATKLSDSEFIERARASAKRRADRQRLRKLESGKVQVNHWLPANAKSRLDALATELNASPSEVVTAAIMSYVPTSPSSPAFFTYPAPRPDSTATAPPLTCINADQHSTIEGGSVKVEPAQAAPGTRAERDAAILELHHQGKSQKAIADQLAERGIVTAHGTPLSKDTIQKAIKRRAGLTAQDAEKENPDDR
jgi:hypothetical protein